MAQHSIFSIAKHALSGHRKWPAFWRSPAPKKQYDVVIVGGGGHGLATAYYLAKHHGITNVAVLEKGWIGGGNTGRNTTIIRSNYLNRPSADFYEFSLKLYEGLTKELNYNIMFSQRGVVNIAYSRHELQLMNRRVNALSLGGIESNMLDVDDIKKLMPLIQVVSASGRQMFGGFIQKSAGTARHDAVAWGYARCADALGVDIIQNCEVTGFKQNNGKISSVLTNMGEIKTSRVGLAVAGHSSEIAQKLDIALPITSIALQAMVSEPVKPILDVVLDGDFYVSQSDRGELVMGGGTDVYTSYAQRGNLPKVEENMAALVDLFPAFSRLKFMRQWAGIVDVTPDSSPIIGLSPVNGVFLNCGWGTYGFKAIPAGGVTFAETIAMGRPHSLVEAFSLNRFTTGALIDEGGSSGMDDKEALL